MRRSIGLLAMAVALSLGMTARADITFSQPDFGNDVSLGNTDSFTKSGVTLNAAGFNSSYTTPLTVGVTTLTLGSPTALYAKNDGTGETGLGITDKSDHEIDSTTTVKLSSTTPITGLTIGSAQQGEGYALFGPNMKFIEEAVGPGPGGSATLTITGLDLTTVYVTSYGPDAASGDSNITVESVTLTPVPEPSTLAIAGLGALGFGAYAWRRRRHATKAKA